MGNSYHNFLENIDKNGLLPQNTRIEPQRNEFATNIFSRNEGNQFTQNTTNTTISPSPQTFGNLTASTRTEMLEHSEFASDNAIIDGFDTDILSNSKFKKIDDRTLKLKIKIARLRAELEEHQKLVQQTFLKTDKIQYQKLLEIQHKMETEIQRLVAEYQNRQLKSIVFSPFVKLLHLLKIM